MNKSGFAIALAVLCSLCLIASGVFGSIMQSTSDATQDRSTQDRSTATAAASETAVATSIPSPMPTVDTLATVSAQGAATTSSSNTAIAATRTAIAVSTDDAIRVEAFAALERERDDSHAVAVAQIEELNARRQIWLLTVEPTAVSIQKTEDTRQLWRQVERDRASDEAHAELIAQQLNDDKQISTAYKVGQIALVGGVPIAFVIGIVMIAHAYAQKLKADRDAKLAEIAQQQYAAELEHDLQMRRAEILNDRDLINIYSRNAPARKIDGDMTVPRLLALVEAAAVASGPTSTVLTPSNDKIWNDDDVRISHREWTACVTELHRLDWIEQPQRGRPTKLKGGATLGDLLTVLRGSNENALPARAALELKA